MSSEWLTKEEQQTLATELYQTLGDTADRDFKILSTIRYDPHLTKTEPKTIEEIKPENFFLLDEHVHRLEFTSRYFALQFEDAKEIDVTTTFLFEKFKEGFESSELPVDKSYKIRLLVALNGEVEAEFHATPETNLLAGLADNYPEDKVYDVYINTEPLMISPFTSFKTTKRDGYTAARNRKLGSKPGREEVLVYNAQNLLMEGSITNVAVKDKETGFWVTPMLSSGCLCGVTRHFLLSKNYIKETMLYISELKLGDEVLLFNGIMGVVRGRVV